MSKKSKSFPKLITTEQFHGLHARYGFTQAEAGTNEVLNAALVEALTRVTKHAMLQAEHEGHTGLNGDHAKKAIEMVTELPKGVY